MTSIYHDLVVSGGGPAGLTAGLYAARSRMDVILREEKVCGGQLTTYRPEENYPGFADGIESSELAQRMVDKVKTFALETVKEKALSIDIDSGKRENH